MLTSQTLLYAMNGIYDDDVILAGDLYFDGRKTKRPGTKQFITVALAAALILSLAIAALACPSDGKLLRRELCSPCFAGER